MYSDRRSSLLGENAEKLLFLEYNIRLFDFKYRNWSLHAELMSPNDWRIVSDIVGWSVSLWSWVYQEIYFFRAFAISCCYRHLQIIMVITHLYSIMDRKLQSRWMSYAYTGVWGNSNFLFFYFSFSAKNVGTFYFLLFFDRKRKILLRSASNSGLSCTSNYLGCFHLSKANN